MHPPFIIVGNSGDEKVLSQENMGPATIEREGRRIRRMIVANRSASTVEISASAVTRVTEKTATNRLFEGQCRVRCPVAFMTLTPNHCYLRLQ